MDCCWGGHRLPAYLGARAPTEAPGALRPILFALAYLLVPLLCYGAFARLRPAWQDRYLSALPGYLLLVAWALLELRGGRLVLAGSLALLYAGGMASSLAGWQKDDWRGVRARWSRPRRWRAKRKARC